MAFVIDPSLVTDYTLTVGTFQESKSGPSEGTLTILPFSWEHLPSLLSLLLRYFVRSPCLARLQSFPPGEFKADHFFKPYLEATQNPEHTFNQILYLN